MNQSGKKCTKMEQSRQKSSKIGASTENSALDENPIQIKWGFEKHTKTDQPQKKNAQKFAQ